MEDEGFFESIRRQIEANKEALESIDPDMTRELLEALSHEGGRPSENAPRRKSETINEHVILTHTKADSAIFNPHDPDHISSKDYNGEEKTLKTGGNMTVSLALKLDSEQYDYSNMTRAALAERQLSDDERFWLSAVQSCAYDNPWETRIYGRDILARWGWANPRQKHSMELLAEAAKAISKMTSLKMAVDVTGEERQCRRRGRVMKAIQYRPIIDALITTVETEDKDGKLIRDFFLDLRPKSGKDATDALPTLQYALMKGQLQTTDSSIFNFGATTDKHGKKLEGVAQVNKDHRRMMAYIYRQIMSGQCNTVLFSTMFDCLGIDMNKHTKSRASLKLEAMLNHWKERGIIKGWRFTYDGRIKSGVSVRTSKPAPDPKK